MGCGFRQSNDPEINCYIVAALPARHRAIEPKTGRFCSSRQRHKRCIATRLLCNAIERRTRMNWDALKGDWGQLRGKVKQKWAKLTDDDLKLVEGKADELLGRIQHHYGLKRDQAEREVDSWMESINKPKQP
jgi:uncharacterized protein YjbJ (UPF0337 family)